MIIVKETINKSLTIKDAYVDDDILCDEDGAQIDIIKLLRDTYGDGTQFTIKVSIKVDKDLNG